MVSFINLQKNWQAIKQDENSLVNSSMSSNFTADVDEYNSEQSNLNNLF
jgi:hypothetical protein